MNDTDVRRVEQSLGIRLPEAYRLALLTTPSGDVLPEFLQDPDRLIDLNSHFTLVPEDLSDLRRAGLLGRIRFWLRDKPALVEHRRQFKDEWAGNSRFVIGTDLGEEEYFIRLTEQAPRVYLFELETGAIRQAASSIDEWVVHARALASSAD